MPKLKKANFNAKYRFRQARVDSPVNCANCSVISKDDIKGAFCIHNERTKKIQIRNLFNNPESSWHVARHPVCDAYIPKPLPEGVNVPILLEKKAILLGTQFRDPYHADPNCPYVIEEARMLAEGNIKRADIYIADLSDKVLGEVIRDICEMPCCESKLPFQILMTHYRLECRIKPDGTEPRKWVRNNIVKHEKKVEMTLEQAENVFDLEKFNSSESGNIHNKIIAASTYLHDNCNTLGSRLLSEATNPVCSSYNHFILDNSLAGPDTGADFWIYDERLFNIKKGLEKPIKNLEKIPEGLISCIDTKGVFKSAQLHCGGYGGRFWIHGLLKPIENNLRVLRGIDYFIDVRAVIYHGYFNSLWGVFGQGFNNLASFHEQ